MKTIVRLVLSSLMAISIAGCGDDDGTGDDDAPTADAAVGTVDGGGTDASGLAWEPIVMANWTIPVTQGAQDPYRCASVTLTEDTFIGGFRPIDPPGTHHTVLSFGPPEGPDDPGSECGPGTENANWVYASGVGTNELVLPAGVGMKVSAGEQVHVNLHLFNTTDAPISGVSGVEILRLQPSEVVHEAEMFLPGSVSFSIPGNQMHTQTGTCNIGQTQTLVALFPHMHQLGTHFKTEVIKGGTPMTLWDEAYQFDSQEFAVLDSIELNAGDQVKTTCTWMNTTGQTVGFGDSSTQEMCFSIMIRYPRLNNGGTPICGF
jgi:hypothetical protein